MQFVDEEDDLALGVEDLLEDGLEPLLELAAVFRAGDQGAHVEADDLLVLEPLRDVAADDPLREALDDRGLADARLADQHGVVLRAARQHLNHAADLVVAPDDGIELALLRERGQIAAVPLERLVLAFRVLVRHALAAANRRERFEDAIASEAGLLQDPCGRGAPGLAGDGDEEVFRADVLVLQPLGFGLGEIGDELQPRRNRRGRSAVHLRLLAKRLPCLTGNRRRVDLQLAQQRRDDAVLLFGERDEQMLGLDLWMAVRLGELLRAEDGFRGFFGEFVEIHCCRQ